MEHANFVFVVDDRYEAERIYCYLIGAGFESHDCSENFQTEKKFFFTETANFGEDRYIYSINIRFLIDTMRNTWFLLQLIDEKYPDILSSELKSELKEYTNDCLDKEFDLVVEYCDTVENFMDEYGSELDDYEKDQHFHFSFVLQTDRGVMGEITRHRLNAFSVSSTRYINYEKKYGGLPLVTNLGDYKGGAEIVDDLFKKIDDAYSALVKDYSVPPEIARGILPQDLWTEIFTTANLKQWKHIFSLRCSSKAHPKIRELMEMVREQINEELLQWE